MPKKIYDIVPPDLKGKVKSHAKKHDSPLKVKKTAAVTTTVHHNVVEEVTEKKRGKLKWVLIGGGIFLLILFIYLHKTLARVNVQIWPKTEVLSMEEKITANKSATAVDISAKVIPTQYIEHEEDGWQVFDATGTASNDAKATGTIRIYNKISPATPLSLKEGTRFLSDSGKIFVTLDKVTIPALKGNSPGSVEVKVQAQESGPDYNIGTSKFSVPGLRTCCGSYYYSVWAESEDKMTGGYTGNLKKVTKDDISQAKDVLTKKLFSQAEESLKSKLSDGDVLLSGAVSKEVIETSSNIKQDTVVDNFTQHAKVKVSALVFKKQDIEEIIASKIGSEIQESQDFLRESLDINYVPDLIDMRKGTEAFSVQFSASTYHKVNEQDLANKFVKKNKSQIEEIIGQDYGDKISNIKVNFWPFWVFRTPGVVDRVKIELNFGSF